ncbi:hypothetical protein [Neptuniibacter sp. QD37_11]|uniref:hypothetical protein n=1 Tax=Neptuniibacter sp. QD37_11 TaxID=3398209 RepID=UPI0039F47CE5
MRTDEEIAELIRLYLPKQALFEIIDQFQLDIMQEHGLPHWIRVAANGLYLAPETGASDKLAVLFAIFHDCRRLNDYEDPKHGARGAAYFQESFQQRLGIGPREAGILCRACAGHTHELHSADPDIGTLWDADRLDLYRVGVHPDPEYFSTEYAKSEEVVKWANRSAFSSFNQLLPIGQELLSEYESISIS